MMSHMERGGGRSAGGQGPSHHPRTAPRSLPGVHTFHGFLLHSHTPSSCCLKPPLSSSTGYFWRNARNPFHALWWRGERERAAVSSIAYSWRRCIIYSQNHSNLFSREGHKIKRKEVKPFIANSVGQKKGLLDAKWTIRENKQILTLTRIVSTTTSCWHTNLGLKLRRIRRGPFIWAGGVEPL